MPANAPTAKTAAWAATNHPDPPSRATASTTLVTHAANRGARTSTPRVAGRVRAAERRGSELIGWRPPDGGQGTSGRADPPSGGGTEAAADAAQVDCAAGGQQGAHGARVADSRLRPGMGVDQGGQLLRPRGSAGPADQPAVPPQVEQRGGAADVELPHGVQVALGVDL